MPKQWTDKPGAVLHGEYFVNPNFVDKWPFPAGIPINTDRNFCKDLHDFCVANPLPRWQWHKDEPPYPSLKQFFDYFDRGNVFVVVFDQDRWIWSWRINSNKDQEGLWMHVRRETDELHGPLGNNPHGGITQNNREEVYEMNALAWALIGGPGPMRIAGDGNNPNIAALPNDDIYNKSVERYHQKFG